MSCGSDTGRTAGFGALKLRGKRSKQRQRCCAASHRRRCATGRPRLSATPSAPTGSPTPTTPRTTWPRSSGAATNSLTGTAASRAIRSTSWHSPDRSATGSMASPSPTRSATAASEASVRLARQVAVAFDQLDRARDGYGASLRVASHRPEGPTSHWQWHTIPCWRRSSSGPMTTYREVANGALLAATQSSRKKPAVPPSVTRSRKEDRRSRRG